MTESKVQNPRSKIVIGSRGSRLALAQSLWVSEQLSRLHPGLEVRVNAIQTTGDKNLAASLTEIGGKGVFTKELEDALLDGRCDIAVHSLKDLPTALPEGLRILCTPPREDTRDILILTERDPGASPADALAAVPHSATVGTSSLRRRALLARMRPDLRVIEFRGNVDTRLRKLREGHAAACILAAAGVKRLGILDEATMTVEGLPARWLAPPWLPAVGQGALAIEGRDDLAIAELLAPLHDAATFAACTAERGMLNELGVGCAAPVAALAVVPQGSSVHLQGCVISRDGRTIVEGNALGEMADPSACGRMLAQELIRKGALKLL